MIDNNPTYISLKPGLYTQGAEKYWKKILVEIENIKNKHTFIIFYVRAKGDKSNDHFEIHTKIGTENIFISISRKDRF